MYGGEKRMYIGDMLKDRMNLLKIDILKLSELSFVDVEYIQSILNGSISNDNIDSFNLCLIASALHCKPEYFYDENIRNKDLLISSYNRGIDNDRSVKVKAKLQDFLDDFSFLKQVKSGEI